MASVFNFKCTEQTAGGGGEIIQITPESFPTQLQVVCVTGSIQIEGEAGNILGIPVSPITITDGQAMNFNEVSYKNITITIAGGTVYRLIANQ
jgi:hypothetical protein